MVLDKYTKNSAHYKPLANNDEKKPTMKKV